MTSKTEMAAAVELMSQYMSLREYAEAHGLDVKQAYRAARKGQFPGAFKFLLTWIIKKDAPVPALPEPGSHVRADGRKSYKVYATPAEHGFLKDIVGEENVIDTRAVAKARREAAKAKAEDAMPFK